MGGGDGKGKSHGKGSAKGKGAGKSGVVPAVGAGPLVVSDAGWAQMSGKQGKLYMRAQNMVYHVNGPSYQPAPKKAPGEYKEAEGSDHWGSESWYYSKGPWVPCQNSQSTG